MFCDICQSIEFRSMSDLNMTRSLSQAISAIPDLQDSFFVSTSWFYIHQPSLAAAKISSEQGCSFCTMLWDGLVHYKDLFGGRAETTNRSPSSSSPIVLSIAQSDTSFQESSRRDIIVHCEDRKTSCTLTSLPSEARDLLDAMTPVTKEIDHKGHSTGSADNFRLAIFWLARCIKSHHRCIQYSPSLPKLPTRVLNVGPPDGSAEPRLEITQEYYAPYVALSHCWGTQQMIVTTEESFLDRQRQIPMHLLPQTFRDAVDITRSLNVRYLWVDSLCIVQDSKRDWERESAQMGRIYRDSLVTIAAVHGKSGSDGCFVRRNPLAKRPCELSLSFPTSRDAPEKMFAYPYEWWKPVGPLYTRSWVLQEQILPTRTLAYTEDTLRWTCVTIHASESNIMGLPRVDLDSMEHIQRMISSKPIPGDGREEIEEPDSSTELYDSWYEVISDYSKRDLSHLSDKLPALSGLASEVSQVLNCEYAAGLWRADLPRGLLWSSPDPNSRRIRPPLPYIAPSWSWASIAKGFISWGPFLKPGSDEEWSEFWIEILDVEYTFRGSNIFGELHNARIIARGVLMEATTYFGKTGMQPENPEMDEIYDKISGEAVGSLVLDDLNCDIKSVSCLAILSRLLADEEIWLVTCLALVPSGISENEYRRVGKATVDECWFEDIQEIALTLV